MFIKYQRYKKLVIIFCIFVFVLNLLFPFYARAEDDDGNLCPGAGLWDVSLIEDICWSCIFPMVIAGLPVGRTDGDIPTGAAEPSPPFLCVCEDNNGVPQIGTPMQFWEIARIIELVRTPYCSPVMDGIRLQMTDSRLFAGLHEKGDGDEDKIFYNYHYYAFPLIVILEMLVNADCNSDGFMDFDLMYISEVDPTWNDDELAFFTNPEVVLFANPFAQAACLPDAGAGMVGESIESFYWCAGTWGGMYPFTGNIIPNASKPRATSLAAVKAIAALHRRGLAWRTMGDEAMCRSQIFPTIPKPQYRLSMFFPIPESEDNHAIGETPFTWGEWRNVPGFEDYVYIVWRWKDCCLR
jgi:conjugal transfer pilus assembly protein TraU